MSNAVTANPMSRALGAVSSKFAAVKVEDLGAGISSGFGVIGYKGKIWSIKAGGTEHKMLRPDDGTPAASIASGTNFSRSSSYRRLRGLI